MKGIRVEDYVDAPRLIVDDINPRLFNTWQMVRSKLRGSEYHYEKQQRYQLKIALEKGKKIGKYFSYHPKGKGPNAIRDHSKALVAMEEFRVRMNLEHNLVPNQVLIIDDPDAAEKAVLITLKYGQDFAVNKDSVMIISFVDLEMFKNESISTEAHCDQIYARVLIGCEGGKTFYARVHRWIFQELAEEDLPDHQNRNGLDNRRANLVPGDDSDNMKNRKSSRLTFDRNPLSGISWNNYNRANPENPLFAWLVQNHDGDYYKTKGFRPNAHKDSVEAALVEALKFRIDYMVQTENVNGFEIDWGVTRQNIMNTPPEYILEKVMCRYHKYIADNIVDDE